ncbi:MAG: OmpA family protein [Chitinophagales bacterium]|nr:OmpA family protein [Chitinophagales bacterium]
MKKTFFLTTAFLLGFIISYAVNIKTETIYFEKDAYTLDNQSIQKLEKLSGSTMFYLNGYTDNDGSDNYNINLSKERVQSVKNYLIDKGVSKNKIETGFFGEENPVNENLNEKQKTLNRRVEIKYIDDPLLSFEVEKQCFTINNEKDTIIVGKEGTEIFFPAKAFANKKVEIKLQEFYKLLDVISANLTTTSNGLPLETSGMINVEAYANNKTLTLQKDIEIKFNKLGNNEDYTVFYGETDSKTMQQNWVSPLNNNNEVIEPENELLDYFAYGKNSVCTTSGDIHQELTEYWNKFCQEVDVYDLEIASCYNNARISATVDTNGIIKDIKTNFKEKNTACDLYFKERIAKYFPKAFETKNKNYESYINISFDIDIKNNSGTAKIKEQKKDENFDNTYYTNYTTNKIIMNSARLGYINCDRYLRNSSLISFPVAISNNANVRMVVKEYKSYFSGISTTGSGYQFNNIPENKDVILIATVIKNDKILLAIEETKTSKATFSNFNFKEVSKDQLQEAMENLPL